MDETKLHCDDVAKPHVQGVGVYENGFVEVSGPCGIDYTNFQIAEWRALNARIEELAKLAGV